MARFEQTAIGPVGSPGMAAGPAYAAGPRLRRRSLTAAGREFPPPPAGADRRNVGQGERLASGAAGSILTLLGLARRDLTGLLVAVAGGALVYRGATGSCPMYRSLGVDTAHGQVRSPRAARRGVHVSESFLVNKPPEVLYAFWHNFENLPRIMTHLQAVQVTDGRRSHWVAKAPSIIGGQVAWDAEITEDLPNQRIAWRSLPEGDVQHQGSVQFTPAAGDRGTAVRIVMDYQPPGGQVGRWAAKLFGEEPEQQIRDDLRNFKRVMEVGEVLTVDGQPHGTCTGLGNR